MMRTRLFPILASCILLFSQSASAQTFNLKDTILMDPDFTMGKLANGLTYYIRDNGKAVRNMQLRLVVGVGSSVEQDDQQGMAHYIEHMNFNGLQHFPKNELVSYLESLGLKFGAHLNAFTGQEETSYILWLATDKNKTIDNAFTILEDWDHNALLEEDEIVKERGVVLEESRLDRNVQNRMQKQYLPAVFSHNPVAERMPIGKDSLIRTFNTAGLRYFYSTWYRPDLTAVIVAGNIDPGFIRKKIDQHFDSYKNPVNEMPKPAPIVLAPRKKDEFMVLRDKEMPGTVLIVYGQIEKMPALVTWNDYRQKLIEKLYTLMLNERLNSLSEQADHSVAGVFASYEKLVGNYRSFNFRVAVGDHLLQEAIRSYSTTLQSTVQYGFLPEELARAKKNIIEAEDEAYRLSEKTITGAFAEACQENFIYGTPIISVKDKYNFAKQEIETISLQEINELGKAIQSTTGKLNLLMTTQNSEAGIDDVALAGIFTEASTLPIVAYSEKKLAGSVLEKVPEPGEIEVQSRNAEFNTTSWTFKNGISVTLKPTNNEHDNIKMDAWRYGGSNNFGLENKLNARYAAMIVQAMGITRFPKPDLDKFLAGKKISVTPYFNNYEDGIEGNCGIEDLELFLQLINAYFTAPAKNAALFQTFISEQKRRSQNLNSNPQNYFLDSAIRFQYQNNPWASTFPDPSDFDRINLDSAYSIYRKAFDNPYGMHFTFVGNFEVRKIKPLLETYLASLPTQQRKNRYTDEGLRPRKGVDEMRLTKGEEKLSRVRLVFTGEVPVLPEERIKVEFLCEVIQMRIMEQLREQMGGIYNASVSSAFNKRPYEHYTINVSFPCAPENVDTLTNALLEIINDIRTNGVEKKYLASVTKMTEQHLAYLMSTSSYALQVLSSAWINSEDPAMATTGYFRLVDGMSSKDLQKTANKYFDMNNYLKEVLLPQEH
jgi:zinc protease